MSTEKKQNRLFQDFDRSKAFNGILAIEPEISKNFMFDIQGEYFNNTEYKNPLDSAAREECFKGLKYHMESSMICEVDNTHTFPLEKRLKFIDTIQEGFKNAFSVGGSGSPSGGVHFHIFTTKENLDILPNIELDVIHHNLEALPLRAMLSDNKLYSRARGGNHHLSHLQSGANKFLRKDDRSMNAVLKNDFLPGIEFRGNNVFDIRLYGYYVGITILSLARGRLTKIFSRAESDKLAYGNRKTFHSREASNKQAYDKYGRLSLDILDPQLVMNDQQLILFKENIGKIYFVLSFNKLYEARKALEEYIKDRMGIVIDSIPFDFLSGATLDQNITKGLEGYKLQKDGIDIFTSTRISIRKMITKLGLTPSRLTKDVLELAMDSISLVKLIPSKITINNNTKQGTETDGVNSIL